MVQPYSVKITGNTGDSPLTLTPAVDSNGTRAYREFRLPTLSPRTTLSADQVSFAQVPPEQELVWDQRDWSKGQGEFYYVDGFYAESDGVETRKQKELSLAPMFADIVDANQTGTQGYASFAVNSNAEATAATFLTMVTGTATRDTAVFNEGVASWAVKGTGGGAFQGVETSPVDDTASISVSISLKAVGMVRGANSGEPRIFITDSVDTTNGTTNTTETFAEVSVTKTIAGTGMSGWGFDDAAGASASIRAYVDEAALFESNYSATDVLHVAPSAGGANIDVMAIGRMIFHFNASYIGRLVEFGSVDATDIEPFNGNAYVAFGTGANVLFASVPNNPLSWGENATTPFEADKVSRALNANGEYVFARAYTNSNSDKVVELTSDPSAATPIWSTGYMVGDNGSAFTNLFEYDGTLYASKEDGLFRYEPYIPGTSVPANRFIKVSPELRAAPGVGTAGSDQFVIDKFMERNGWAYFILKNKQFWRYDGRANRWQDLTEFLRNDTVSDRGGRAKAMTQDARNIYVMAEGSANEFDLIILNEGTDGRFRSHTFHTLASVSDIHGMWMRSAFTGISANVYVLMIMYSDTFEGGSTDVPKFRAIILPSNHEIMRHNTTARVQPSGQIVTSYMDWNSPDVDKSFNKLTILSEGLSTSRTVALGFEADDDSSFSTLPTVTTSPSQTVSFPANTTGRRVRLRYGLNTTNTGGSGAGDGSPVVKGHVLRASWRPTVLRAWEFSAEVAEGAHGGPGGVMNGSVSEVLSTLRTLEQKTAPIKFTPMDSATAIDGHIKDVQDTQMSISPKSGVPTIQRRVSVRIEEAIVS